MLTAFVKGDYRAPWPTLVLLLAAVVYFLNPFDFIPDVLLPWGLVDDSLVIAWVVARCRTEIDKFTVWRQGQHSSSDQEPELSAISEAGATPPDPVRDEEPTRSLEN
ncbi:MAG: DUF1232 domain-containing protein [Acidobacteriota bacterium]|nr:DUF1232 domain-containing protein [Acidobacteriota bacterium]